MRIQPTVFSTAANLAIWLAACAANPHLAVPSRQTTGDKLALPGSTYYPESLSVAADGTLYVGSIGGGGIVRIGPSSELAQPFVPAAGKNIAGVYVDDDAALVYACENDLAAQPPAPPRVVAYRLADGSEAAAYPFAQPGVCNDLAIGRGHHLYATDSAGRIYVLAPGAKQLAVLSADPALAPSTAGGFGVDGVAWDGEDSLYVNLFSDARLLRIRLQPDGSAGEITPITVSPALVLPDGMRMIDAHTLLVVEGEGRLTQVSIKDAAATAKVITQGLDSPTSVAITAGAYWVSEGQIPHFLGAVAGPPNLPFSVRRIEAR